MNFRLAALAFSLGFVGCQSGGGYDTPDQLVDQAAASVRTLRQENETLDYFLARSKAVLVFPEVVRAGLIFGVAGGKGVLMQHDGGGVWGPPSFVKVGGVSFGAQAGAEKTQVVVVIMNERLIDLLAKGALDFGLASRVSLGPGSLDAVGSLQTVQDAYVYRDSHGAYAGLTLDGAVANRSDALDTAFRTGDAAAQQRARATLSEALALEPR